MRIRWSNEDRGIWRRIERKLRISDKPLKERIVKAMYSLQVQRDKLEHTLNRLQRRDRQVFERCIGAHLSNDVAHAVLYANECAEIRKMAKLVISAQLSLERVILRLETVKEFGDIMNQLTPVLGIVREVGNRLSGIMPEVSSELDKVHRLLNQTVLETGIPESMERSQALSNEAKRIMEEASAIAEQKIREKFPELPKIAEPLTEGTLNVTVAPSPVVVARPVSLTVRNIDEEVFNYIVENQGKISVRKCALELKLSPEEVRKALDRLREKGRIRIV